MKVALVYLHVIGLNEGYDESTIPTCGTFQQCAERFSQTFQEFPPDYDHELIVVFSNGSPVSYGPYHRIASRFLMYEGTGWCSGAHQHAARNMNADFAVFMTARTHFWKRGWLAKFVKARMDFGEGMYSAHSSNEGVPHLRTAFYGLCPHVLSDFPHPLDSREASRTLESGEWNLSQAMIRDGKASALVTWEGVHHPPDWRKPDNIFRRGDQSNCLVLDRHTELYRNANEEEKQRLERLSDP